jgi:hypothetical protein
VHDPQDVGDRPQQRGPCGIGHGGGDDGTAGHPAQHEELDRTGGGVDRVVAVQGRDPRGERLGQRVEQRGLLRQAGARA